ncbi:MAG: hypothetical protein WBG32_00025, partial [Nodosilinea sp.]
MSKAFQEDEVLKAHLSRQQELGKLLQKAQKLIGDYETELLDTNDLKERSKYQRQKEDIQQQINKYLDEISLLNQEIESRKKVIESLNKSYFINPSNEQNGGSQPEQEAIDFASKIQHPFIRELEIRLRSEVAYWQKSSFPKPDKSKNYTASYFSYAWKKLEALGGQLQISDHEEQQSILDQIESQLLQVSQLVSGITQSHLSSTLSIELNRVVREIKTLRNTARKVQFIRLD